MKDNSNIKERSSMLCCVMSALTLLSFSMSSCRTEEEPFNWVDLRYKVEDEYNLPCKGAEPIKFQVKSTDPWIVYSQHEKENWCTITPSSGDDPECIYDVEVLYADNTELDDRVDTLIIQSDYWIGKWVTVKQKGTAYLKYGEYEPFILPRLSSEPYEYKVLSNQSWTAEVTEGKNWLKISDPASGKNDGTFTVTATDNNGEMRKAVITLFDRHGQPQATTECVQDGVQLELDNNLFKTDYSVKDLTVKVKSNTEWTAELEDPATTWLTIAEKQFENDADLVMSLSENNTKEHREAVVIVRTTDRDGAFVVEYKVTVKQAYKPYPVRYEFTEENFPEGNGTTGWSFKPGVELIGGDCVATYTGAVTQMFKYQNPHARYKFKIKAMDAGSRSGLWFKAKAVEFRYFLNAETKKIEISNNKKVGGNKNIDFNPDADHELEFEYQKGSASSKCKVLYYFDGKLIHTVKDAPDPWNSTITLYIGSQKGKVVYDWMEVTLPVSVNDL